MTVSIKLARFNVHCDSTEKTAGSRLAHVRFRGKEDVYHSSQLTQLTMFLTLLPTNIRVHQFTSFTLSGCLCGLVSDLRIEPCVELSEFELWLALLPRSWYKHFILKVCLSYQEPEHAKGWGWGAPCDGLASHSGGVLFAFARMVWNT